MIDVVVWTGLEHSPSPLSRLPSLNLFSFGSAAEGLAVVGVLPILLDFLNGLLSGGGNLLRM